MCARPTPGCPEAGTAWAPFNQLWLNAEWDRVTERSSGQLVSEFLRPGIVVTGARNLEWWTEIHAYSHQRPEPGEPLLRQRFIATGLVMTPARWFPMLDTHLEWGQKADTVAKAVRPGGYFKGVARLRPLSPLELDITVSTGWLRHDGRRSYGETAVQGLAVWHFDARHTLRAIVRADLAQPPRRSWSGGRRARQGPHAVAHLHLARKLGHAAVCRLQQRAGPTAARRPRRA